MIVVEPIQYPQYFSEFEIQAFMLERLLRLDIDARGEVTIGRSRFDIVVFESQKAVCIIEIKKLSCENGDNSWRAIKRQISRYSQYGIPVALAVGMSEATTLVSAIAEKMPVVGSEWWAFDFETIQSREIDLAMAKFGTKDTHEAKSRGRE